LPAQYKVLFEKNLVRGRAWVEFSVYPLFSPRALISEGTANFGIDVAFPRAERAEFERRVLFPAARLKSELAAQYYEVLALVDKLSYAGNEAARRYRKGQIDARAAADWLEKYGLYSRPRAEQRVRFIDQYRSYVVNLGKDMVAAHVEARGGNPTTRQNARRNSRGLSLRRGCRRAWPGVPAECAASRSRAWCKSELRNCSPMRPLASSSTLSKRTVRTSSEGRSCRLPKAGRAYGYCLSRTRRGP
jgi:hypothetical protein